MGAASAAVKRTPRLSKPPAFRAKTPVPNVLIYARSASHPDPVPLTFYRHARATELAVEFHSYPDIKPAFKK